MRWATASFRMDVASFRIALAEGATSVDTCVCGGHRGAIGRSLQVTTIVALLASLWRVEPVSSHLSLAGSSTACELVVDTIGVAACEVSTGVAALELVGVRHGGVQDGESGGVSSGE